MPGGFEVLENCVSTKLGIHMGRQFLTDHKQHGTRHLPGCKWRARPPTEVISMREENHYTNCAIYLEERVVKVEHLGAHEVLSANSTEDDNVTPDTLISKNTNTAASVKTSEGLGHLMACLAYIHIRMCNATYLVVKTSLPDHVDEDVVSLSGDLNSLLGDIAKNSDSDSRAAFSRVSQHSKHSRNEKLKGSQHTRGMDVCQPATRECRADDQLPVKLSKSEIDLHTLYYLTLTSSFCDILLDA